MVNEKPFVCLRPSRFSDYPASKKIKIKEGRKEVDEGPKANGQTEQEAGHGQSNNKEY